MVDVIGQLFFGGPKRGRPKKKVRFRKQKRKSVVRKALLKGSRRLAKRIGIALSERKRTQRNIIETLRQEQETKKSLRRDFFE